MGDLTRDNWDGIGFLETLNLSGTGSQQPAGGFTEAQLLAMTAEADAHINKMRPITEPLDKAS